MPNEDQGYFIVTVQGPEGTSLNQTQAIMDACMASIEADRVRRVASGSPLETGSACRRAAGECGEAGTLDAIKALAIAIDPLQLPLGAPVYLSTTEAGSDVPLQRLVMAQDTGGAIRGAVRADFYFGFGYEAMENAGRMKQRGQLWVLMPKTGPGR